MDKDFLQRLLYEVLYNNVFCHVPMRLTRKRRVRLLMDDGVISSHHLTLAIGHLTSSTYPVPLHM